MTIGHAAPGDLMCLAAKGLTARGFDVHYPRYEDERRLTIAAPPGLGCAITIEDCGTVEWAYWPRPGHHIDPGRVISLALTLLAPDGDHNHPFLAGRAPSRDTLRSDVGRVLKAAGLNVGLDVLADQDTFDVTTEIVVTSPGHPGRGQIRIGDDGRVTWECHYDLATIPAPAIAETVVDILARYCVGLASSTNMPDGPVAV